MSSPAGGGANPARVYWDSCVYLDYLQGDHPLQEEMQRVLDDWRTGGVTIVTSALTIAEVLYVKCEDDRARMMVDRAREPEIVALFDPPPEQPLTIVEVSRVVAMAARELVWEHSIKPKDAIHIASALVAHCPMMHTNDEGLHRHSGQLGGNPLLRIEAPSWIRQSGMDDFLKPS